MKKPGRVPRQKIEDILIQFLQDFGMKFDNQAPSHTQALHTAMLRLQKLIKLVEQEQELVRQGADREQLCRHARLTIPEATCGK